MNKKDILNKIKSLDGLTPDERAYLVNLVNTKKKYGLVWEDKPEDVEEELRTKLPVLKEVKERAIINDTETEKHPNHILIEGDNLHALTALTFTHENKIDLIYIDPPYNTGNKDFIYNDSYVDKEDAFRHSKWISFMEKRLKIAHKLLADDGVIFISIDDNEQAQLKMLCDEIFGEINAIGPIIQNKLNAKNDTINIQRNHEFIHVYRKSIDYITNTKIAPSLIKQSFKRREVFQDKNEFYYLNDSITTRGEGGILNARPNLGHTIYYNPITSDLIAYCDYNIDLAKKSNNIKEVYSANESLISKGYIAIRPPKVRGKLGCWTWSIDKINEEKRNLIITGNNNKYQVKKRTFVEKEKVKEEDKKLWYYSESKTNSRSIIEYSTNAGTDSLNNILNVSGKFNNPKNVDMLKYCFSLKPQKNSSILDFFAGSGTTLHAAMELNNEDGGNRQCILVTNNENNIAEEVTYERNKRIIQGYTNSKGEKIEGLKNNNLRYYQTAFEDREPSLSNKRQLTQLATEFLCIKEDCYQEVTSQLNQETWNKCFTNGQGQYVYVVYDDLYIDEAVAALTAFVEKESPESRIKVYVFANGQYAYHEEFEDLADNITLAALPDAIYKAYQNILPKENKEFVPELEEDIIDVEPKLDLN